MITVHNTLSGKKEEFTPLHDRKVSMYVCGITPYDEVHLGHARAYVVFDIIRRYLDHVGYEVHYIQNFTDVDDKIIRRAQELNTTPYKLSQRYIDDYFIQMDKLNVMRAQAYPRVTEMVPEIVEFIGSLIEKGFAYELKGDVYYSVRSFPGYGKLSKRSIEDLRS